jgi:hypothetical protein
MKLTFPSARWIILAAINLQCVTFYIFVANPQSSLRWLPLGNPAFGLKWLITALFAVALYKWPATSIDRFGRSVMVLAAVYWVLIAVISEWGVLLSRVDITDVLAMISAVVQTTSLLLLARKLRGRL